MFFGLVYGAWFVLIALFLPSQVLLVFSKKIPQLFSVYFLFLGIIMLFAYMARYKPIFSQKNIVAPTDGVITHITDRWMLYDKYGFLLAINCGWFDEWVKVSPVDGKIVYLRYHEDKYKKKQLLIIKIKASAGQQLHILHFMVQSRMRKRISGLKNNLYVGLFVRAGQPILTFAFGCKIIWFIEASPVQKNINLGNRLYKGIPLPITFEKMQKNQEPSPAA
jgi:hypothetical protein